MCNKKIVYINGDFDPTLCSGVSASFFDLFKYLKTLGYDPYIVGFSPEWVNYLETKDIIEQMGGNILSCSDSHIDCILEGINISCERLPYSRMDIRLNKQPEVLKRYIQKLKEFSGAYFFTADIDLTSIVANVIVGTNFAHHVRSPVVSLDILKSNSPMYISFLKSRKVFTVSSASQKMIKNELGISSSIWTPFIDLNRFKFKEQCNINNKIGYYSAGLHKGDAIVKNLIKSMPDCHFIIMGNGSYSFSEYPNVSVLGRETNLKNFYSEVSLILIPSTIIDGHPRITIEAAINGIPVIANKIGGIPEALGDSGIMVSADLKDTEITNQYRDIINSFFNEDDLYKQYSKKAYRRAEEYRKNITSLSSSHMDMLLHNL